MATVKSLVNPKILKKIKTENQDITKLQDNLIEFFEGIINNQLLKGQILSEVRLASGSNTVDHKLGRTPVGYIVVKKNANISIWDSGIDDKFLKLQADGSVTADIFVF